MVQTSNIRSKEAHGRHRKKSLVLLRMGRRLQQTQGISAGWALIWSHLYLHLSLPVLPSRALWPPLMFPTQPGLFLRETPRRVSFIYAPPPPARPVFKGCLPVLTHHLIRKTFQNCPKSMFSSHLPPSLFSSVGHPISFFHPNCHHLVSI